MSHTLSIEQMSEQLSNLVRGLGPADEIVLTENDKPVARIVRESPSLSSRQPGLGKGMLEILDDGDDVINEHFKEYMP